ncbi:hypothetical protein [Polaribacter sp. Z022]|uniref:hypothetical protein n=1 Tax=Polaribacter sp. Z022 TaxID=2927125 RepID=UPI0020218422|nr:hypothetical protein [Polaribacter sp. Z022]MCL7752153.1 hypothetical protein [Polaribacter sp. Z022]
MNLKRSKNILITISLISLIGFGGYSYIYKSHKKIEFKNADFEGKTNDFFKITKKDSNVWLDKTIVLEGIITKIDKKGIVLDNSIYCQFNNLKNIELSKNSLIKIKGNMIGFDDLLEEIKLNQCIILK